MPVTKVTLRSELKTDRLKLSGEVRQACSAVINECLLTVVNWPDVRYVHYFEPLLELGEVDIAGFLTALGQAHPQIDMYTTRKFDDVWQVVPIDAEQSVGTPEFDVIIVPMLGFDPDSLHRLGYGGGFYDKFLNTQLQAQKIGVCFEQGRVINLPSEAHDVPLDLIVTDRLIYKR